MITSDGSDNAIWRSSADRMVFKPTLSFFLVRELVETLSGPSLHSCWAFCSVLLRRRGRASASSCLSWYFIPVPFVLPVTSRQLNKTARGRSDPNRITHIIIGFAS